MTVRRFLAIAAGGVVATAVLAEPRVRPQRVPSRRQRHRARPSSSRFSSRTRLPMPGPPRSSSPSRMTSRSSWPTFPRPTVGPSRSRGARSVARSAGSPGRAARGRRRQPPAHPWPAPVGAGRLQFKVIQTYDNGEEDAWIADWPLGEEEPTAPGPVIDIVADGATVTTEAADEHEHDEEATATTEAADEHEHDEEAATTVAGDDHDAEAASAGERGRRGLQLGTPRHRRHRAGGDRCRSVLRRAVPPGS